MLKNAILLSTLLALIIGQALAVNCDLSCGLTGGPSPIGTCGVHTRIASEQGQATKHCHHCGSQAEKQSIAALNGHSCGLTFCRSGFDAARNTVTKGALPRPDLAAPFTAFVDSFLSSEVPPPAHLSASGRAEYIPLDVRPDSPLRI
jgi:hypothetical protein